MNDKILVPPRGPISAKIAIIGEAPGVDEITLRKPFVGASGNELKNILEHSSVGIPMNSVYLDNVCPERPPGNNFSYFLDLNKKIPVSKNGYDEYVEELKERLEKTKANVFVALGNAPLFALTGIAPRATGKGAGITARRGSVYPCTLVPGRKVIPNFHPSTITRGSFLNKWYMIHTFRKVKRECEYPDIRLPHPHLIISPTFDQTMEYLEHCSDSKFIVFDIEGIQAISCISFAYKPSEAICIPFLASDVGQYWTSAEEVKIWKMIGGILEDENIVKCNQNINYDASDLHRLYGICSVNLHDTMVAHKILYPDYPADLGFITLHWTNYNYYKDEGHDYVKKGVGSVDQMEQFWHYSAMDSIIPFAVFPAMEKELKRQENWETYVEQVKGIEAVLYAQASGTRMDNEGHKKRGDEINEEMESTTKELQGMIGEFAYYKLPGNKGMFKQVSGIDRRIKVIRADLISVPLMLDPNDRNVLESYFSLQGVNKFKHEVTILNPNSVDHKMAVLYGTLGMDIVLEDGKVTTNEKAMKKLRAKYGGDKRKVIELILKLQGLSTRYRNYYRLSNPDKGTTLFDPRDDRLRCAYNVAGTKSARWSSSVFLFQIGRSLQNLPKKTETAEDKPFRKFMLSDKGNFWIKVDLSMAENRIVAYKGADKRMMQAFENGEDLHRLTAALILNKPLEEVTKWERDNVGKPNNHGGNYGQGPHRQSEEYGIPYSQAAANCKRYSAIYTGVARYQKQVMNQLYKNRTLTNLLGRKLTFRDRLTSKDDYGVNAYYAIPQSTVGDIISRRGVNEIYYKQDIYHDFSFRLQIHDEIDFQAPLYGNINNLWNALCSLKASLEQPLWADDRKFIIPADFEFGLNLWDMIEISHKEWTFDKFKEVLMVLRAE